MEMSRGHTKEDRCRVARGEREELPVEPHECQQAPRLDRDAAGRRDVAVLKATCWGACSEASEEFWPYTFYLIQSGTVTVEYVDQMTRQCSREGRASRLAGRSSVPLALPGGSFAPCCRYTLKKTGQKRCVRVCAA